MTWNEAVIQLREGKKIRQSRWVKGQWFRFDIKRMCLVNQAGKFIACSEDMTAVTDWEVVEDKKAMWKCCYLSSKSTEDPVLVRPNTSYDTDDYFIGKFAQGVLSVTVAYAELVPVKNPENYEWTELPE